MLLHNLQIQLDKGIELGLGDGTGFLGFHRTVLEQHQGRLTTYTVVAGNLRHALRKNGSVPFFSCNNQSSPTLLILRCCLSLMHFAICEMNGDWKCQLLALR